VGQAISSLGWFAPLVLLPYFLVYVVDCLGWAQILRRHDIPFASLLRIRWAGESVNNVVPSAYIGGEAVKVGLLRSKGVGTMEGTTTAIVSKTAQTVAQMIFILVASVVFLVLTHGQPGLLGPILLVTLCSFMAILGIFWIQKVGLFGTLLTLFQKAGVPMGMLQRKRSHLLRLDETILGFYRSYPGSFYASTGFYLAGWMLDSLEIWLVAHLLGMPIGWPVALVVEAFTGIAKACGMWVPGSLGIQESGIVLIGRLTGLPDTLITAYACIRRAREAIFACAGIALLKGSDIFRRTGAVPAVSQRL
jgi:glycosyltransferase 2 family protein